MNSPSTPARLARVVCVALLFVTAAVLRAAPAAAHSAANSPSSNYVSEITSVRPDPQGRFRVRVIEAGSRLELHWRSGPEVIILGYDQEPYLRIGPRGVEENRRSPSVTVNRTRTGEDVDPSADSDAEPVWQRISGNPIARWHDHRIHQMVEIPLDRSRNQVIRDWEVTAQAGDTRYVVRGRLSWVPGPSPVGWLMLSAVIALVLTGLGLAARAAPVRAVRRLLVAAIATLVVVDVVHLLGIVFGVEGSTGQAIGRLFTIGYASVAAWVMATTAAVLLARGRDDALYLVVFAAGLMFIVGGLADLSSLSRTSLAFAFSATIARVCVSLTLGLGLGLAVAGVLGTRPAPPRGTGEEGDDAPGAGRERANAAIGSNGDASERASVPMPRDGA